MLFSDIWKLPTKSTTTFLNFISGLGCLVAQVSLITPAILELYMVKMLERSNNNNMYKYNTSGMVLEGMCLAVVGQNQ